MRKKSKPRAKNKQRTYYVAAEYIDHGDRLLVQEGKKIELYSIDLKLAQHCMQPRGGGRASISNLLKINVSPGKWTWKKRNKSRIAG